MSINILKQWPSAVSSLSQAALAERKAAELVAQRNKDKGKITPTQQRKNFYSQLCLALEEKDHETVVAVLDEYPTLGLNERGWTDVTAALIKNFHTPTADVLTQRGLEIAPYLLLHEYHRRHNVEVFEYLVTHIDPLSIYEVGTVVALLVRSIERLTDRSSAVRSNARMVRQRLCNDFPQVVSDVLKKIEKSYGSWHHGMTNFVLHFPADCDLLDRGFINTIPAEAFANIFDDLYYAYNLNSRDVDSLNRFLTEFAHLLPTWQQVERTQEGNRMRWNAFWAKMVPSGTQDLSQSPLIEAVRDDYKAGGRGYSFQCGGESARLTGTQWESNLADLDVKMSRSAKVDQWLGFDWHDRIVFHGSSVSFDSYSYQHNPNDITLGRYGYGSFLMALISKGATALEAVVLSEDGMELLHRTLLADRMLLTMFCANSNVTVLQKLLKERPQWTTWRDDKDNTLAHYLVALRKETSKNFVTMIARADTKWLTHANANNITVRHLLGENEAPAATLALLNKETLKRTLKEDDVLSKVVSRPAPAKKRRM